MSVMKRRIHPLAIPALSAITLASSLALWPAAAGAKPRNDSDPASGRDSSRASGNSGSAAPRVSGNSGSSAPRASSAPSTPAGDTRPTPGASGRVDDDARDRGVFRGRGSRRGHGGSRGHYGGHYGGYYGSYGYYPWGWFGYWGSPYLYWGDYYGSPYGRTVVYPNNRYGDSGALDMDVSPERAEIYLDGERIGRADDFDGFPSLLWLEKGTYDVAIYLDGFRTIARQVTIYPGLIVDVEDRMERGESVRPEDLPSTSHVRRDARIREDRARAAEVDARERDYRTEDWRARRGRPVAVEPADEDTDADDRGGDASSMAGSTAAVRIAVEPADASVYLDGHFVGTGSDLARLPGGIVVEPGEHELEVVRPGHQPQRQSFGIRSGEELELEVELIAD